MIEQKRKLGPDGRYISPDGKVIELDERARFNRRVAQATPKPKPQEEEPEELEPEKEEPEQEEQEAAKATPSRIEKAKSKPSKWPEAPLPPPDATALERLTYPRGLLGHVVQYMYDTAGLPDRFLALAGALSALGKCCDRKVLGPTGNSTILFLLVIAETGAGKNHILNCIRIIFKAADMEDAVVASGIASVQSVEEILEGRPNKTPGQPSPLVLIDEYGSFLTRISSKNQTGNVSEIPSILQSLWGWSPEAEWKGSMKMAKEIVTVYGPAFAIFATSTERVFFTALKRKEIGSGFVNRHILINAGRGAPERVKPQYHWTQCPGWLMEALKEVAGDPAPLDNRPLSLTGNHGVRVMLRDFRRIDWGPGAEERWYEFEKEIRSMPSLEDRELWIRAPEIAERIATVVAVFRGSKLVDLQDLEWAIELARHSTRQLAHGLKEHMLESYEEADLVKRIREEFERKYKEDKRNTKVEEDQRGILTQGQIHKVCERLTDDLRKINRAICHLQTCGDIEATQPPLRAGRPTTYWKWIA